MRLHSFSIAILLLIGTLAQAAKPAISLVPLPMSVTEGKGTFAISANTQILHDNTKEFSELALLLAERIKYLTGSELKISIYTIASTSKNNIILTSSIADQLLGNEGYTLEITKHSVFLRAQAPNGIFYGLQTLFQLLPYEPQHAAGLKAARLPVLLVKDKPRYTYRGMHLDVCRHIFPVAFVKRYIDLMAMYKINTFHWHLTDDQGWRIEIKQYPKLTQVSAFRKGTQIGHTQSIDTVRYGGFYTQAEAREIVAYAASKFITVIPEIEMPGHAVAALAAYPALSCTGGPFDVLTTWGVSDDIFCAGNDSTFVFLQNVLSEIKDIFPSTYIHIGGDEAPKDRWRNCPKCQQRIKSEGLKNEAELQSYLVKRIENFLVAHDRKLIGWDEILEGGLSPEATVMAWQGLQAGIEAAAQGHDAIMTPVDYCYFDYYQSDPANEPLAFGRQTSLKTVYSYNPTPPTLTPDQAKHIIGVQGNLWTEYITNPETAEFRAYPRAIALAEIAWSQQERRSWDDFLNRLDGQFPRLDALKVNYSKGSTLVDISTAYDKAANRNLVSLSSETTGKTIRYTIDGSEPTEKSAVYRKPFVLSQTSNIKAALFENGKRLGPVNSRSIIVSKATGKPVNLLKPYSFKYPASGQQAMTDGLFGGPNYKSGWQGYENADMEFTVDLLQALPVKSISMNFVQDAGSWVIFPLTVTYEGSTDGKTWKPLYTKEFRESTTERTIIPVIANLENTTLRYIRVSAVSSKVLPEWHAHKGEPCWIFSDELMVE